MGVWTSTKETIEGCCEPPRSGDFAAAELSEAGGPSTEQWPAFPTFDQRTLAEFVQEELADRGEQPTAINERREEYARDLLLVLDEDIRPPSITTDGARSILQRPSQEAEVGIDHPKHGYLAPHGGHREMRGPRQSLRVHGRGPISQQLRRNGS